MTLDPSALARARNTRQNVTLKTHIILRKRIDQLRSIPNESIGE